MAAPTSTTANTPLLGTAPAVDFELEAARNRILALVHLWMSVWDANRGDAAPLLDLLSPEGFTIELLEEKQTLTTIEAVRVWFARFPQMVKQDVHIVESVDISRAAGGRWRSVTHIRGPGLTVTDQPFLVRSLHDWEVVDYGGLLPRVARMTIRLVRET